MKTNLTKFNPLACFMGVASLGLTLMTPATNAATVLIESAPFSLNYGFNNNGSNVGMWTADPSSSTTATTLGDFTFLPTFTGSLLSEYGVTFANGVLTNGTGQYSYAGDSVGFVMTLSGTWNGATPSDAAPNPNYRISLIVNSMSLYGLAATQISPSQNFEFNETTPGHTATSPSVTVPAVSNGPAGFMSTANYAQLVWNPSDYFTDGVAGGRTFGVTTNRVIDGFQISGQVVLSYDAVPEPSTYVLLTLGMGFALVFARKRAMTTQG